MVVQGCVELSKEHGLSDLKKFANSIISFKPDLQIMHGFSFMRMCLSYSVDEVYPDWYKYKNQMLDILDLWIFRIDFLADKITIPIVDYENIINFNKGINCLNLKNIDFLIQLNKDQLLIQILNDL